MKSQIFNPYLPCYEYIPDAEPRVFGDRLYVFGSHDRFGGTWFCENDYVTWSAPIDDLSDWRYEGVIYTKEQDKRSGNLYAPDVVQGLDGRYYLYYSKADTSVISVAVCDEPAGRYEYLGDVCHYDGRVLGEGENEYFQFDPAVLIDDGRIWLYSGSGQYSKQPRVKQKMVGCMVMELETDMLTLKSEPKILLPGSEGMSKDFFEGASARRINGLYYLVFPTNDMSGLNYAVSRYPDRDFVIRGSIHSTSDVGINGYTYENPAYSTGNNHGGLVCIKGQWYIFDHRQTNNSMFCRQGVAEPVTIEADGTIRQVESTSCGMNILPLAGEGEYPAHIACNLLPGGEGKCPFITQDKPDGDITARQYVTAISDGCCVGYKYFELMPDCMRLEVEYRGTGSGRLEILRSGSGDDVIGETDITPVQQWQRTACPLDAVPGKTALFFRYRGTGEIELLQFAFKENC